MTDTVSQAVATREASPAAMLTQYKGDFGMVLPSHFKPDTFVRLAQGVLRKNRQLARIATENPGSLMAALLECARLGHEPGTEAFYLVPMGGEIEGWEGYRGVVERMYRSGAVDTVKAELVKTNDRFEYDPGRMDVPDHRVDWFGDRGPTIGAYAYAVLAGGATSRVVVINREYIEKVRAQSKGSDKSTSPWKQWEDAMILKTVIHRLEPFVPTSAEYRQHVAQAGLASSAPTIEPGAELPALPEAKSTVQQPTQDDITPPADPVTGEVVDAEVLDPDEPTWPDVTEPGGGQ